MEVKAMVSFQAQKNDRTYVFNVENGAPFSEALEAAAEIFNHIEAMAKAAAEKAPENEQKEAQSEQPLENHDAEVVS